jgi:hypothetical protein
MLKKIKLFLQSPDYTAWLISVGMVFFTIHNKAQPLITYMFLPQIGVALICFGLVEAYHDATKAKIPITLGSKWVWIPMLIIIGSCYLRIPIYGFQNTDIAGALFFSVMFGLYLASRIIGDKILIAFLPATIIEAISTIILGLMNPGVFSAGILSSPPSTEQWTNYELAAGFMLFGFLTYQGKYKWQLGTLVLVAMFFTGAPEGFFLTCLLMLLIVIRRDWNWRKVGITAGIILPIILAWTLLGFTFDYHLWGRIPYSFLSFNIPSHAVPSEQLGWVAPNPIWSRIYGYQNAIKNFSLLGNGITLVGNTPMTVHNVPGIIIDQIGIIAGIAWTTASIYLLKASKYKYLWVVFLAMGLVDHYTWGNAAPWWWAIAGMTMVSEVKNDFILKT